jgi:hypothetical protein
MLRVYKIGFRMKIYHDFIAHEFIYIYIYIYEMFRIYPNIVEYCSLTLNRNNE